MLDAIRRLLAGETYMSPRLEARLARKFVGGAALEDEHIKHKLAIETRRAHPPGDPLDRDRSGRLTAKARLSISMGDSPMQRFRVLSYCFL